MAAAPMSATDGLSRMLGAGYAMARGAGLEREAVLVCPPEGLSGDLSGDMGEEQGYDPSGSGTIPQPREYAVRLVPGPELSAEADAESGSGRAGGLRALLLQDPEGETPLPQVGHAIRLAGREYRVAAVSIAPGEGRTVCSLTLEAD